MAIPIIPKVQTAADVVKKTVPKPYTVQDFVKDNQGYSATWNPTTKTSTVTDNYGNSINFASGKANDAYGVSGQLSNNSNVIDANKLKAAFTQQQMSNPKTLIEQQAQQQMAAQAAAIQAARDRQVSDYNSQIAAAPQQYQPLRNEASYAGAKNLQAAKEVMAAQGLQNSGDNVSAQIQTNTATQNNINALNQDEQNLVNQLKKAIADANSAADVQTLQSNADINAQKLQALLNQTNADRSYGLDVAGLTGTFNGQRTLAGQQLDTQNQQCNKQFGYQQQRDKVQDNQWQQSFNYQKQRDTVKDTQWQKEMNLNLRQQSFAEAQAKIENALAQKRINMEGASQALQWAKFNADNDPNSLDNQLKRQELNYNNSKITNEQLGSYNSAIENQFARPSYDAYGQKTGTSYDYNGIKNYIKNLESTKSITSNQAKQMLAQYGFTY
jgi:hypothetical protein